MVYIRFDRREPEVDLIAVNVLLLLNIVFIQYVAILIILLATQLATHVPCYGISLAPQVNVI